METKLTIQDRAGIASSDFDPYGDEKEPFEEGYIVGATEQRQLDAERAIQCFKDNWRDWLLGVDHDGVVGFSIDEEQVRKYMKGE